MSEERETAGKCGWAALGLVMILLFGLFPGSLFGGLTGLRLAELFGLDHAYELAKRLLLLAGMIVGLLVSTLIIMGVTIASLNGVARFRQALCSRREHSFLKDRTS